MASTASQFESCCTVSASAAWPSGQQGRRQGHALAGVDRVAAQATESRTASAMAETSDALARTTGRCRCLQIAKRLSATHRPGQTRPPAAA